MLEGTTGQVRETQSEDAETLLPAPVVDATPVRRPGLLFKMTVVLLAGGITIAGIGLMLSQMSSDASATSAIIATEHGYSGPPVPEKIASFDVDPMVGKQLYNRSCASCHGPSGAGMPPQGVALRDSAFVRDTSDQELVSFTTRGRTSRDPKSLTGRVMPPLGGDRQLSQQDVADIVAYMRQMQHIAATVAAH